MRLHNRRRQIRPDGDGTRGPGFWILDWELRQLGPDAEPWMWSVLQCLEELYVAVGARMRRAMRVYVESFDEGYAELLRQRGFPAEPVGEELPPLAERFNRARPYVTVALVTVAQPAHERLATFNGAIRNFLRELTSATEPPQSNPLALAYATAILITYHERPALPPPKPIRPEEWRPHDFSQPWRGFRVVRTRSRWCAVTATSRRHTR